MSKTPTKLGRVRDRFPNLREVFVSTDSIPLDFANGDHIFNTVGDPPLRSIRATGEGVIAVQTGEGVDRELNIAAGETRHLVILKVYEAGTTATGLEGMP